MGLKLIGPHPFAKDEQGAQKVRIGTLFLEQGVLYTQLPGVHAWQRSAFIESLNAQRAAEGKPPLSLDEEDQLCARSVDLIFDPAQILIRPNPQDMDSAFAADEQLQELVSKRQVVFLSVSDPRVRDAIKRRGECWRLSFLPKSREGKKRLIFGSKVALLGQPIYYYNRLTGTRWLTCEQLSSLEKFDDANLAAHLQEIAEHSIHHNRLGRPELDFFAADLRHFGARKFAGVNYAQLPADQLRARFQELKERFLSSVHESFRGDDCTSEAWCQRMLSTLFLDGNEAQTEQILSGLSPEFFMQVEWLPGGRFEEGEFLFDPVFEEAAGHPEDADLQHLCDPRAKGIIFNFIREYGNLEYINVGRIPESLSIDRPQKTGRRGVYIAEFQTRGDRAPIKRFMRLQKWGVWEHLDEGKDLAKSIEESNEYTDFWLDRRLGCRQLGVNITSQVLMRQLTENYAGGNPLYRGQPVRTTYFEREYLSGIATDKLPVVNYSKPEYAPKLATLLGRAAASSMIVGRSLEGGLRPVFDDGDEVVCEGDDGLPSEIMLGDHSGAFGEYRLPLETFAAHYARPVNTRDKVVANPRAFAQLYLEAFREKFLHIQGDYRKRRRAFDTLFKHCKYDRAGSFAYRWECVLRRLDQTDADMLIEAIRRHIWVLNLEQKSA
jgi:hypothetical protein